MTIKYALTKCFVNAGHKALRESSKEGESRYREGRRGDRGIGRELERKRGRDAASS